MTEDRQDTIDRLCNDYLDAKMYAEKYKDAMDAAKAAILNLDPQSHELRGVALTKPRETFDEVKAKAVLSPEQLSACYDTKLSGSKAKKVLPPAIYAAVCSNNGQPGLRAL